jgi:hypothetical protein
MPLGRLGLFAYQGKSLRPARLADPNVKGPGCKLGPLLMLTPDTRMPRTEVSKGGGVLAGHVLITRGPPFSRLRMRTARSSPQREEERQSR